MNSLLPASGAINSFLLIRLSSLGDILLTTTALRCLRKTYPAARIDVIVKDRYLELLQNNPNISSLIPLQEPADWITLRTLRNTLKNHYKTIIDLHTGLRSSYLRRRLNADKILVYKKRRLARWLLVKSKHDFYGRDFSVPLAYLEALAPLGVQDDGGGSDWPGALSRCQKFLEIASLSHPPRPEPIALCPGASFPTKRWPAEYWQELTKRLVEKEQPLWVFGEKSDAETGELLRQIDPDRVVNYCGRLSLSEAGAGLSLCRAAVTHDAGPAHMAGAVGVPVVAIFGSTVTRFGFRPFRVPHRIAEIELPCRPCSHLGHRECPLKHFRCMKDLSVNNVLALLENLEEEVT